MHHYYCYKVWSWTTRANRIAKNVSWFPIQVAMSVSSSTERAVAAENDLTNILHTPSPAKLIAPIPDNHFAALDQLSTIFTNAVEPIQLSPNGKIQPHPPPNIHLPSGFPINPLYQLIPTQTQSVPILPVSIHRPPIPLHPLTSL